jgi:hypothetical protein
MSLNITIISFADMHSFAETLECVCVETGKHILAEDFFEWHLKQIIRMESNKQETLGMIEEFITLLSDTNSCATHSVDNRNILYIENLNKLIGWLRYSRLDEMPMFINSEDVYEKTIALWRLKIGK